MPSYYSASKWQVFREIFSVSLCVSLAPVLCGVGWSQGGNLVPLGCFSWTTLLLVLAHATEGRLSLRSREAVCSACPKKTLVELLGAILMGMDFLRAPGAEILRSRWQQEVSCAESTFALGLYIVCSGCAHRDLESLVPIVRAKSRWTLA